MIAPRMIEHARADARNMRKATPSQRARWRREILAEQGADYLAEVDAFAALLERIEGPTIDRCATCGLPDCTMGAR